MREENLRTMAGFACESEQEMATTTMEQGGRRSKGRALQREMLHHGTIRTHTHTRIRTHTSRLALNFSFNFSLFSALVKIAVYFLSSLVMSWQG